MLKFCSLYSGSTGNSLYVESENTKILVDAGVSAKKITDALTLLNVDLHDLSAILVTHEHTDHIQGVGTLSKKFDIPVYANSKTWDAMKSRKDKIIDSNQKVFYTNESFEIGDLKISSFKTPHDAAESCGFNIENDNSKISIATDLGHINTKILDSLQNSKFLLLEANYEPEILKCCSYPFRLKTRIAGENGHLANHLAGQAIAHLIPSGLNSVMLGHLSKESNFPELAYKTVIEQLNKYNYDENSLEINVASRFEPSKIIEVS